MKFYLNLFLSKENLNYEVDESDGIRETVEIRNDRILERKSRIVGDIKLSIVLFQLNYPKKIENAVETPNEVMESHYDTSLILELFDKEENKLYTFYDLIYSSNKTLKQAQNKYHKLDLLINSSDDVEVLLKSIETNSK